MRVGLKNGIEIADEHLCFKAVRSSGPGGQNVNKANTRVTVFFDAAGCTSISDGQRKRILKKLRTRANKLGVIRVSSQRHRSQNANLEAAIDRLSELLNHALEKPRRRKKTVVPAYAKKKRLQEKNKRSRLKQQRRKKRMDPKDIED